MSSKEALDSVEYHVCRAVPNEEKGKNSRISIRLMDSLGNKTIQYYVEALLSFDIIKKTFIFIAFLRFLLCYSIFIIFKRKFY